jgi:hypothetical protein
LDMVFKTVEVRNEITGKDASGGKVGMGALT